MAELRALRKHWRSIIDAIPEDDVGGINHYLFANEVYGPNERDAIDSKQTASEKMTKLLKAVEKKIRTNSAAFKILVKALREESAYSVLADKLERTRDELRGEYYSSCSDEGEEQTDESSDDDDSDVQEVVEKPRKRSRGRSGRSGKKKVKKEPSESREHRPVPPSVRTRKSRDKRNGNSDRRKPKEKSGSKATASSENGSVSRNGSSGSPSVLDTEPTEKDLRKLVAGKISDPHSLGTMLDVDYSQVEIFTNDEKKTVLVNMKILTTWIISETKMPTTWSTLLEALRDMGEKKLARDITKELEQRGQ